MTTEEIVPDFRATNRANELIRYSGVSKPTVLRFLHGKYVVPAKRQVLEGVCVARGIKYPPISQVNANPRPRGEVLPDWGRSIIDSLTLESAAVVVEHSPGVLDWLFVQPDKQAPWYLIAPEQVLKIAGAPRNTWGCRKRVYRTTVSALPPLYAPTGKPDSRALDAFSGRCSALMACFGVSL